MSPEFEKPAPKRLLPLIGGILAVIVLIVGVFWYLHTRGEETTDDAFIDAHIVPISAKVAGQVEGVGVNDNQPVRSGDELVRIDPRDYAARVSEHRAKVLSAEADARRASMDAQRYRQIYERDEISKQQLDHAEAVAASTQANLQRERAALEQAELNLSYTRILAPEAGRVTRKAVVPGAYVQVGQMLLSIVPEQVFITANFKETQLTHLRAGQKVRIRIDAYPGKRLEGHVDSIQSGTGERFSVMPPENATGNFVKVVQRVPVKILIDTPAEASTPLIPGMSCVPTVYVK